MQAHYDVVILGGGLAGLTLARQLRQERSSLRVLVLEKRSHPAPEAAHKVGESSVEIGAHYFGQLLGLHPHMVDRQLPKFGIRYFFDDGQNRDLRRRYELGPRRFPRVQSYQLDRGRLENFLFEEDQRQGCDVLDRTVTTDVVLGDPHHTVHFTQAGAPHRVTCRWVVDATGRRGFLKGKFGLRRPSPHKANATWWRVAKPLKLDDWSADADWQGRVDTGNRWLSTNHLMGPGYWVWFIPLGSGSTSVGIVVDAGMHPYPTINRLDRSYAWLDRHEPQAAEVCRDHDDLVEDFLGLNHYPHGCARVYSNERWALTGEAGVFTDPFYSPGSDFIGVSNDLITEMILRDGDGIDIRRHAAAFNAIYLRLFDAFTKVYENQYQIFGNGRVMTAKVAWDNACYWGVSALLFFQRKYRDYAFIQSIDPLLRRFFALHVTMQDYLREWHRRDTTMLVDGFASVVDEPYLWRLQNELDAPHDDASLRATLEANVAWLEKFAAAFRALESTTPDASDQRTVIPPVEAPELVRS